MTLSSLHPFSTPSATVPIPAFLCNRGKDRRAHLRKVSRKRGETAHLRKVERGSWKQKRGHRRYRGPRAIAHLRKVSRKRGKTAHLRKVGEGGWKRKRGYRRYREPRAIAHLRKVSRKRGETAHLRKVRRNAEKHDSFQRSEEVSGKLWNEGDAKGWTGPKREGDGQTSPAPSG